MENKVDMAGTAQALVERLAEARGSLRHDRALK